MLENFSSYVAVKFSKLILPSQWNPPFRYKAAIAQITSFVIIVCGVRLETQGFTSR